MIWVDTSAFIALTLETDPYHRLAANFANTLGPETRLLTSNFILAETMTYLNRRHGPEKAYTFGDRILRSSIYEIAEIDTSIFHDAMKLLQKFSDKDLSFTDLTSFALMRLHKIKKAFTFDGDFMKAGFQMVPNENK